MSFTIGDTKLDARLACVREHVRSENNHDINAIMRTFGETARYDDEPWDEHHKTRVGVYEYYCGLLRSMPDLYIDVKKEYVCEEAVILEVIIRGTHKGTWRGLPATGRRLAIPLCGVFTFDNDDRLAGERIYYDRATVLKQLGVFTEPNTVLGQLLTAINHPVTMARIAFYRFRRKLSNS